MVALVRTTIFTAYLALTALFTVVHTWLSSEGLGLPEEADLIQAQLTSTDSYHLLFRRLICLVLSGCGQEGLWSIEGTF